MMKNLKTLIVFAFALIAMSGCKSQFDQLLESGNDDLRYTKAFEYFNAGKYGKAAQLFEAVSFSSSGTERDDTVRYYVGLSHYSEKDYYTAETNFDRFVQMYPMSPFAEAAKFLRIDCLYKSTLRYELDQTPTYKALSSMSEYLVDHPDGNNAAVVRKMISELGDRLDLKAFENARLYYKMEDYKAARVALKNVLKDDAENVYREQILYYTAMSSYKLALNSVKEKQKERYLLFIDDYFNFIGEYPESGYRKELDNFYNKVK